MSLPSSSTDNPEEIEIDRLLLELGIELPAVESIASTTLAAGINGGLATSTEDAENSQEEDEAGSFWLPLRLIRMIPRSPETES